MTTQTITVTHILPTGTAFGATTSKPPESVFIPGKVAREADVVVGQQVEAILVPNTMQPDRTPWLAAQINILPPMTRPQVSTLPSVADRVLETLKEGGEWTDFEMSDILGVDPREVTEALETIYNKDLCAKYQLWRKRSDAEPSDEWFTCFPDEVDFVTGAE
jgi:hypothetical protein